MDKEEKGMMYCLGCDLGTSALKMTLVDQEGKVVDTIEKEYPLSLPLPSYSEQNPKDWVDALLSGLKEIGKGREDKILSLCIDGQMHGLVALDSNGEVIRPCILWNDARSDEECQYLNCEIGKEWLLKETGNIAYPGFTLPKLLWMKNHEPEKYQKIHTVLLPKDYLNYVLTGKIYSDYSDAAGTLLFDVENKTWSTKMISLSGLIESCFPPLCKTGTFLGCVKDEILTNVGIKNRIKVYQGAADNAAAAIGNGIIKTGECNISLGTSGTILVNTDKYVFENNGSIHSFLTWDAKPCLLACMLSCASCIKWLNDKILRIEDYNEEQAKIKEEDLGRNSLFFLPYLMGERSPINDAKAKGVFFGLGMDTSRAQITQSVLEGISFALKDSFEAMEKMGVYITESYLTGGGSTSPLLRKMLASILNIPLYRVSSYGPSYGMALISLVEEGFFANLDEAKAKTIQVHDVTMPDENLVTKYKERYLKFKKLYPTMKNLFEK